MVFEVPTPRTPLTRSSYRYWNEHLRNGYIWATPNRAYEFIHRGLVDEHRYDSRQSARGPSMEFLYKSTGADPIPPR
jgi:hypothetical protein